MMVNQILQEAAWRLINKEEPLLLLKCLLFPGARGWEAAADPGGGKPRGRRHTIQCRHHSDLHGPPLLLCHCAFCQVWPDCGHQHRHIHFVHPDRDCGHVGVHGPRALQKAPRGRSESCPGCDGGRSLGSGCLLGGRTAGSVGLAISQNINTTGSQLTMMSGRGVSLHAKKKKALHVPPRSGGTSDQ